MNNLDEKLINEMNEILKKMADLSERKYRCLKENGIVLDNAFMELHELNLQMSEASCHYHLLQGFIAGMKYSSNRKTKQSQWSIPERYEDFIKEVLK